MYLVVTCVQVVMAGRLPTGTKGLLTASTIVVIGGSGNPTALSQDLVSRLEEGLSCYRAHLATTITVTGSAPDGPPSMASAEASWLEVNGVNSKAIRQVMAPNTAAQLNIVATNLKRGHRVIVVSDAIDDLWVKGAVVADGLSVEFAPALGSVRPFYDQLGAVISQTSAVAAGRIIGFSQVSWG